MLTGINKIDGKTIPSIECWAGTQKTFQKNLFYELGIGVGRLLTKNDLGTTSFLGTITFGTAL